MATQRKTAKPRKRASSPTARGSSTNKAKAVVTRSPKKAVAKKAATARAATNKTVAKPAKTPARSAKTPAKASVKPAAVKSTKSAEPTRHPVKTPPNAAAVARLRAICLALPETSEVQAWGEPTFRVKGKIFAMHASSGNHHGAGRPAVWILSVSMEQDMVLRARPDRYFKPPYVGPSGWIGAWLDNNPPWGEIEELLRDGWRRRAPKKVAALIGD